MRILLAAGMLAWMVAPAMAGPNANGAMVVHTDDSILYTTGVNFCAQQGLPATCDALGTRTDKQDPTAAVIFAMAAFLPTAAPCVSTVQFGIHHNLPPNQGYIYAYSMCGTLELPDAGWPEVADPGVGDLVATANLTGHLFPFYWFACVGFTGAFFETRTYPSTNEAKFVDCSQPPIEDLCTNFGTVRWFAPGANNCPVPPPAEGACCFADGHCGIEGQAQCQQDGGQYQGDNSGCSPNPCPQPQACCFQDGHCEDLLVEACTAQGGTAQGPGTTCQTVNCPPPASGACCLDAQGDCQIMTPAQCENAGGNYMGDGTTCEPNNPCSVTRLQLSSWGRIKAGYR